MIPIIPMAPVISNGRLVVAITVRCIHHAMVDKMAPWVSFVHHYFVTTVQIITSIGAGQAIGINPAPVIAVNKLLAWHGIVCLYFREIIIFCVVIADRTPRGLKVNIHARMKLGGGREACNHKGPQKAK